MVVSREWKVATMAAHRVVVIKVRVAVGSGDNSERRRCLCGSWKGRDDMRLLAIFHVDPLSCL